MESFSLNGVVQEEYLYNALGQQVVRRMAQDGRVIHVVHDLDGNRLAEYEVDLFSGTVSLLQEYIWFEGAPVAVVDGATGAVYSVRTDHIGRPIFATDDTGLKVWEASYLPFGGLHVETGTAINLRFPGQWFHSSNGLHQNWMRDYDPTLGRYIQADPLGLVDGASVYGYALQNPGRYMDPRGLSVSLPSVVGTNEPLQCNGEDCFDQWEEEQDNCHERLRNAIISNLSGCLERARDRFTKCYRGEAMPPEWSEVDEGVGQNDEPDIRRRLLPPPLILPVPPGRRGGGGFTPIAPIFPAIPASRG